MRKPLYLAKSRFTKAKFGSNFGQIGKSNFHLPNPFFFTKINILGKKGKENNSKYCFQDKFRPNWTKIRPKWAKNTALPQCLPQACLTSKLHFESEFWSKNVPILSYSKEKLPTWHFQGFFACHSWPSLYLLLSYENSATYEHFWYSWNQKCS